MTEGEPEVRQARPTWVAVIAMAAIAVGATGIAVVLLFLLAASERRASLAWEAVTAKDAETHRAKAKVADAQRVQQHYALECRSLRQEKEGVEKLLEETRKSRADAYSQVTRLTGDLKTAKAALDDLGKRLIWHTRECGRAKSTPGSRPPPWRVGSVAELIDLLEGGVARVDTVELLPQESRAEKEGESPERAEGRARGTIHDPKHHDDILELLRKAKPATPVPHELVRRPDWALVVVPKEGDAVGVLFNNGLDVPFGGVESRALKELLYLMTRGNWLPTVAVTRVAEGDRTETLLWCPMLPLRRVDPGLRVDWLGVVEAGLRFNITVTGKEVELLNAEVSLHLGDTTVLRNDKGERFLVQIH